MPLLCDPRQSFSGFVAASLAVAVVADLGAARIDSAPPPLVRAVQAAAPRVVDAFAADVSIRQARVGADGRFRTVPISAVSLRLERARRPGGWRTTLTFTDLASSIVGQPATPRSFEDPFLVARVEYDNDGTALRLYNGRGEPIAEPTVGDRESLGLAPSLRPMLPWPATDRGRSAAAAVAMFDRPWLDGLVAGPERFVDRRRAIGARFGPPAGRVGRFDRHVLTSADVTTVVLVDPDVAVPVDITSTRTGAFVGRTTFDYEPHVSGALVRRLVHSERAIPQSDDRAVIDVEVTNVVLGEGGGR